MDFSNSVILPREDFIELETAAFAQPKKTFKDRSLDTLQASVLILVIGGVVAAGAWASAKASDWYERKYAEQLKKDNADLKFEPYVHK